MFNYIIISLILLAGLLANIFLLKSIWIGMIFTVAFFLFYGFRLGGLIFKKENKFWKLFFGLPLLCATIIIISTPIYYFYQFNVFVAIFILAIIPLILSFFKLKPETISIQKKDEIQKSDFFSLILYSIFLILEIFLFCVLFKNQTFEAIRTPWQIINNEFLIIYFFASFALIILLFREKNNWLNLLFISIHSFLTIGLGLIIYKIGYGFDPFIHRATENLIFEFGAVEPKPFYYIGQYAIIAFFSKIFSAPIEWIDKLILPVSVAIFMPSTIFWSFKKLFKDKNAAVSTIPVLFLTVPLTQFIATTPQGLANFFTLFLVFLSVGTRNRAALILPAFAALMIHPLAGIPALIFIGFCEFSKIKNFKTRYPLLIFLFFISVAIIPFIFIVKEIIFNDIWRGILKPAEWSGINFFLPSFENRYGLFYDFAYFYKYNLPFIIIIFSGIGAWLMRKNGSLPYFLCATIIILNAIFLKLFINFPQVIKYEQADYANRLFQIAGYFLLPLCIFISGLFFKKMLKTGLFIKTFFILILSTLTVFSIYLTYPRVDRYELSHNINTSLADIRAVNFIEENAENTDYIVLANQAVSAAALREFGFKKYYETANGNIFYYPIPTGGKLYEYFLEMVYKEPSREIIKEAMNLTGVKQGYFVLNKYWTNSERILKKAKNSADEWWSLDNDVIFVLKYTIE